MGQIHKTTYSSSALYCCDISQYCSVYYSVIADVVFHQAVLFTSTKLLFLTFPRIRLEWLEDNKKNQIGINIPKPHVGK